jgi:long-chain acyl-CoA synthetase
VAWLAKQVEVALAEVDLTLPQYRVLTLLDEGSARSSDLAQRLAVRPPSVTSVIDGLVLRALVERGHAEQDRRQVTLQLTAEGALLLARADAAVDERLATICSFEPSAKGRRRAGEGLQIWQRALVTRFEARRQAESAPAAVPGVGSGVSR